MLEFRRPPDLWANVMNQSRHQYRPYEQRVEQYTKGNSEAELGQKDEWQYA
jgi:hypothetical protein